MGAFGVVVRPVKELRGFDKLALQPASEAHVEDFLQDQPMIKFPYFTMGEVNAEQIKAFIAECNSMTFTP